MDTSLFRGLSPLMCDLAVQKAASTLACPRAGIELTLETAKGLRAALDRVITAAEFEEAEVRGKGVSLRLVQAG
jgi:hypothetical protein